MQMKHIRKWARILHRDLGFFFFASSLIFGVSGIALNHLNDWDPNYVVKSNFYETNYNFAQRDSTSIYINLFLTEINEIDNYKTHAFLAGNRLKIYLIGGSSVLIDLLTNNADVELLKKRGFFYDLNYLHYNPHVWWMWFSDFFAASLIFFALSSLVMVRGRKGFWGRGAIYVALGVLIPKIILHFF